MPPDPRPSPFARSEPLLRRVLTTLVFLTVSLGSGVPAAQAAEYRDPGGHFTLQVPDGFYEVDQATLQAIRTAVGDKGRWQVAFDRGTAPRLMPPILTVQVTMDQQAGLTTDDLQTAMGPLNTEKALPEKAAAVEHFGLGDLLRDPRTTEARWEPERLALAVRRREHIGPLEVFHASRIYFHSKGTIILMFYYQVGTPYEAAAERFTGGLTVLPEHRVPPGWRTMLRPYLLPGGVTLGVILVGLVGWAMLRRSTQNTDK